VGITDKERHMKAEITNELLKQAVADAEAVRDTAIANAKLALEESITPAIKSMLAKRLRTELESSAKESPTGTADGKEVALEKEPAADSKEMTQEELEASGIGTGDNKEPKGFESSAVGDEGEEAPSDAPDSDDDYYDDWDDSDFDLEEIIKELEGDITEDNLVEKMHDDEEHSEEEMEEASHEAGAAHPAGKREPATIEVPPMKKKETEHGEEEEKKLDLEAIIRELVAEAEAEDEDEDAEVREKEMANEITSLKAELAEHREAVTLLRDKLQEVHLLNAKLLYTNKLFQKGKLTNEQAVRVLDSFDRAKTLREVKMVYALMVENVKATRTEGRVPSRKTVVTEGLASRATASTAPKKEQLLEENSHIKRLQYLAGINS
jgi:hypothetical protein